ncbi:hypothetical protein N9891_00260 [bacterium]|nr:hypothetical protein [bacterium]
MNTTEVSPDIESPYPTETPTLQDKSRKIVDSVSDFARKAGEKSSTFVDEKSSQLGGALANAATKTGSLQDKAESGYRETLRPSIHSAQNFMEDASTYLQQSSPPKMADDLVQAGKRNPKAAAGILIGLGFLIGRALTSSK